jgi:hypothetical protein
MSMTTPRPLLGVFRTDFVLLTVQAVTQTLTGHPNFPGKTEPMTGRES